MGAPIVVVPKADKSIRICGDYKVTINSQLEVETYPLPNTEDLFATLAGGKWFSKLDLSHAYQQLRLDKDSEQYLTINTDRRLYCRAKAKDRNFNFVENDFFSFSEQLRSALSCGQIS